MYFQSSLAGIYIKFINMRYIITLIALTSLVQVSIGQIEPKQNDEAFLRKLKVKSLKTYYYSDEDTTKSKAKLLFKKEYDRNGNLKSKYLLSLWDVVSYDHTTTYLYDKSNRLLEKIVMQNILNLGKRDQGFTKEMGDDPINKKFIYRYNDKGQLVKEDYYSFGKEGFSKEVKPSQTISYNYSNDLLIKETGVTPNGMITYQNYIKTYEYDASKRKIKESTIFTTDPGKQKTVSWVYNNKGLIVEEIIDDRSVPSNNNRVKYVYDNKGRKIEELEFSSTTNKWESAKTYSYDNKGNLISGDPETTFGYYANGLIKMELWKSSTSDETVNFITVYEYY